MERPTETFMGKDLDSTKGPVFWGSASPRVSPFVPGPWPANGSKGLNEDFIKSSQEGPLQEGTDNHAIKLLFSFEAGANESW